MESNQMEYEAPKMEIIGQVIDLTLVPGSIT